MELKGLITAVFTPMHADGSLNLAIIDKFLDSLEGTVLGIFICGTTGEGVSLTVDERMTVAEAYVKSSRGRFKIFIHVGHNSLQDACKLAQHAHHIGVDAISALPPVYFKPDSVKTLVANMAEISEAAPDLPFYYYHIPSLTGINFSMEEFLRLAEVSIPAFSGIKFTHYDLSEYMACLHYNTNKFDIMFGMDEMMLGALAVGAQGFIGSTYNFMAPVYRELINSFNENDMIKSQKCQMLSIKVVELISKYGGRPAQKTILKISGYDFGPVRSPLKNLSLSEEAALKQELEKIDFFKWSNKGIALT